MISNKSDTANGEIDDNYIEPPTEHIHPMQGDVFYKAMLERKMTGSSRILLAQIPDTNQNSISNPFLIRNAARTMAALPSQS